MTRSEQLKEMLLVTKRQLRSLSDKKSLLSKADQALLTELKAEQRQLKMLYSLETRKEQNNITIMQWLYKF